MLGEGIRLEFDLPLANRGSSSTKPSASQQLVIENSLAETNFPSICCNCELQASVVPLSTEWRHGWSISTIWQWPEVLLRPSRHRASQHGGHRACPAKDAGRHGRPRPAPGRDGGGHASPLVWRPALPADLGFRPARGGHRADHVAQDYDAGKSGEFERPV